jgi:hypothetical protein
MKRAAAAAGSLQVAPADAEQPQPVQQSAAGEVVFAPQIEIERLDLGRWLEPQ